MVAVCCPFSIMLMASRCHQYHLNHVSDFFPVCVVLAAWRCQQHFGHVSGLFSNLLHAICLECQRHFRYVSGLLTDLHHVNGFETLAVLGHVSEFLFNLYQIISDRSISLKPGRRIDRSGQLYALLYPTIEDRSIYHRKVLRSALARPSSYPPT